MSGSGPGPILTGRFAAGTRVPTGANAPLPLEDPATAWLVEKGRLEVFAVRFRDGRPEGPRHHLFTVGAAELVLGVEPAWAGEVGLLAVGSPDSVVNRLPVAELQRGAGPDLRTALEGFVATISAPVTGRSNPRRDVLLTPGETTTVAAGSVVSARRGVVWIVVEQGTLHYGGRPGLVVTPDDGPFPLASEAWLRAERDATVRTLAPDSEPPGAAASRPGPDEIWRGVRTHQQLTLAWADRVIAEEQADEQERMDRRVEADRSAGQAALNSLATVISARTDGTADLRASPLLAACRLIGDRLDLEFTGAPSWERTRTAGGLEDELRALCRASVVGHRRVVLEPRWWARDNGPLLAFQQIGAIPDVASEATSGDGATEVHVQPVALLEDAPGQYFIVNPTTGARVAVDETSVGTLRPFAYQFYRSLPERVTLGALWRFVTFRTGRDLRTLVAMGLLGALLGLLVPVLTGIVFDWIIPSAERGQLLAVFVALAVAALAAAAFDITRSFAVIRLQVRIGSDLQMAVLQRLVSLPVPFYRRYTAGDLGVRAGGINRIGEALSGATISSIMGALVSAGAYVLLWYYSWQLAVLATGLLAFDVAFTAVVARFALRFARERAEADGHLSGLVLQLLTGIPKLRVAGAEVRAFARWAEDYRRQRHVIFEYGRFDNKVQVFNAVLSIASVLLLYWAYTILAGPGGGGLSTGQFLAFNAAFGMFMGAARTLTGTAVGLLALIPLWERARPILDEVPEADPTRADPGELTGRIEVSHLTFAYDDAGPVILQDICLHAEPGEFIAIVGPSGAGKSTLLRILLGFDAPESSSVYFDGHDLATVDITAVRRQIGVVLQSSRLTAGDIYTNIVGASQLSREAAWDAARMSGLEADLREMPMGLHTVISEGGSTLSGGQRQRLLIARALVHRPRIIFFDEATSALDNRTQRIVSDSIEALHATRIVVAHRLSTIRHADRIYVLDAGHVVQVGSYDELMAGPGLFAELAARQEV